MKTKLLWITATILILTVFLSFAYLLFMPEKLSYKNFDSMTKTIVIEGLKEKFENVKVAGPLATAYPGKQPDAWAKTDFDVVDNNAAIPKKVTAYIIKDNVISKVNFIYQPEITVKAYLNVMSLDSEMLKKTLTLPQSANFPYVSVFTFSTNGMMVQVTSCKETHTENNALQTEDVSSVIMVQTEVVEQIKALILKNNY